MAKNDSSNPRAHCDWIGKCFPTQCFVLDTPALLGLARAWRPQEVKREKLATSPKKDSCTEGKGLTWLWSLLVFFVILEHMKNTPFSNIFQPKGQWSYVITATTFIWFFMTSRMLVIGNDNVWYKLRIRRVLSVCWLKKLEQEPGSFAQMKEEITFPSNECCRLSVGHWLRELFPFF